MDQPVTTTVYIKPSGNFVTLPSWAARLVEPRLSLTRSSTRYSPESGFSTVQSAYMLIYHTPKARAIAPAGLRRRIAAELRRLGYRVVLVKPKPETPGAAWAQLLGLGLPFPAHDFLARAARSRQLNYYSNSERQRLTLLLVLLAATRGKNVLVVVKNEAEAVRLAREVAATGRPVCIGGKFGQRTLGMVYFDTPSMFLQRMRQLWDWVVFYDPDLVRSVSALLALDKFFMPKPARLAFGPPSTQLTLDEQLLAEVYFGPPVRPRLPGSETIFIVQLRIGASEKNTGGNPLERKRRHVWLADPRNNFIAQLAVALANGSADLAPWLRTVCRQQQVGQGPDVAVLVETELHAQELRSRLGAASEPSVSQPAVTVLTWPHVVSAGVTADVIIVADGLQSAWPKSVLFVAGEAQRPLVIDVAAMFDRQAQQAADDRLADYEGRSWIVQVRSYQTYTAATEDLGPGNPLTTIAEASH